MSFCGSACRLMAVLGLLAVHALVQARTVSVTALNMTEAIRAKALSGAVTAVGNDHTLVWHNPASPGMLSSRCVSVLGQRGFFGNVAWQVLGSTPLKSVVPQVLTVGVAGYNFGTITVTDLYDVERRVSAHEDYMLLGGLSMRPMEKIIVGASMKILHSRIFDQTSMGGALDAGAQFSLHRLCKAGVVLQNFGPQLKYLDDRVYLPAVLRWGVALGGWFTRRGMNTGYARDAVIGLLDVEYPFAERIYLIRLGVEYQLHGNIFFRFGTHTGQRRELSDVSAGVGFSLGRMRLDYSARFGGEFEMPHALSLTVRI